MKTFKEHLQESSTKVKWIKVADGYKNKKMVYKHVTSDGKFEIRLSGMDSMKMNKDGSQKVMPTVFDKSRNTPKHPVIAYKNVATAKAEVERWIADHE
jgi:hypothetical protein